MSVEHGEQQDQEMVLQTFFAGSSAENSETFAPGAEGELVDHPKAVSWANGCKYCEHAMRTHRSQGRWLLLVLS
jgi:hypothetical protein